ncbi:MAG: alpha-E domain-containing protein, partial [Anaerolineae bacterium]|nr:alpha-E domain-containing protein [Anaerolineae bacterium]
MLSRVADSLYWMSRYLERAEHTARLLDVHSILMLEQVGKTQDDKRWIRVLEALRVPITPE